MKRSFCFVILVVISASGCSTTLDASKYERWYDHTVHVTTRSGTKYEIVPIWSADTVGIHGRGLAVSDSSKIFRGTIPRNEIERVSVTDNLTPAIIIIASATAIFLYIRNN